MDRGADRLNLLDRFKKQNDNEQMRNTTLWRWVLLCKYRSKLFTKKTGLERERGRFCNSRGAMDENVLKKKKIQADGLNLLMPDRWCPVESLLLYCLSEDAFMFPFKACLWLEHYNTRVDADVMTSCWRNDKTVHAHKDGLMFGRQDVCSTVLPGARLQNKSRSFSATPSAPSRKPFWLSSFSAFKGNLHPEQAAYQYL